MRPTLTLACLIALGIAIAFGMTFGLADEAMKPVIEDKQEIVRWN